MHTRHADPRLQEDEDPRLRAEERGLRRNPPTSTLIGDLLPQNLEITHLGCLNHPVCASFLQEAQETDALEDNRFSIKSEDEINHIVGAMGKIPKGTEDPSCGVTLFLPPEPVTATSRQQGPRVPAFRQDRNACSPPNSRPWGGKPCSHVLSDTCRSEKRKR